MAHGDKSETTQVVLLDTTRVKLLQTKTTIDVVIPAFNEGSCIEGLLHDVMMVGQHDWFQIQNSPVHRGLRRRVPWTRRP